MYPAYGEAIAVVLSRAVRVDSLGQIIGCAGFDAPFQFGIRTRQLGGPLLDAALQLRIEEFSRITSYPSISGIMISAKTIAGELRCGGI
jgi:hypothetical protein